MIQILSGVSSTSSALESERVRMEVISQNIANVNTTEGPDGEPYRRKQVVFKTMLQDSMGVSSSSGDQPMGVKIHKVIADERPFQLVHQPGHPHADPQTGMVRMPGINVHEEMADMIAASRSFEANLAVFKNARAMALQTLSIGRG